MRRGWLGPAPFVVLVACARPHEPAMSDAQVEAVVARHCRGCHSDHPTVVAFPIAPAGVELDSIEQVRRHAARVRVRVSDGTMPLLNKTGMTDEERALLAAWALDMSR